jgi:hypothetical protein
MGRSRSWACFGWPPGAEKLPLGRQSVATPFMKRALKRTALDPADEDQEPLPFFSEPTAIVEEPAAQVEPARAR